MLLIGINLNMFSRLIKLGYSASVLEKDSKLGYKISIETKCLLLWSGITPTDFDLTTGTG